MICPNRSIISKLFIIGILALGISVSGCGKNIVGPTTPNETSVQAAGGTSAESMDAACFGRSNRFWSRGMLQVFLLRFLTPKMFEDVADDVTGLFLTSPTVRKELRGIVFSPLFRIFMFETGAGRFMFNKTLRVLSRSWYPGIGSSPNEYSPELTLFPYAYSKRRGFHGSMLPGWFMAGGAYTIISTNSAGDRVQYVTSSGEKDVYQNQKEFYAFQWSLFERTSVSYANINFDVIVNSDRISLYDTHVREHADGDMIFQNVWTSLQDKSSHFGVGCTDGKIDANLTFDATGAGGGTLTLENSAGTMDTFEFVQNATGHGYWTKNGGRKRYY